MTHAKNQIVVGVLLVTTAVVFMLVSSRPSGAQSKGSAPVSIVDPLPLPVTGSVTDSEEPARNYVNLEFQVSPFDSYTVPSDTILVIDWVSVTGGDGIYVLDFLQGDATQISNGTDTHRWSAYFSIRQNYQPTRIYAKGGQTIRFRSIGTTSGQLFAQGHLLSAESSQ